MAKYMIVHLIRGEAGEYHKKLAKDIAEKFNLSNVTDRIAPHLTLKAPFDFSDISTVEATVEGFTRRSRPGAFEISGFGAFERRVIFLNAKASPEMVVLAKDLQEDLHFIPTMTWDKNDRALHFHATIASWHIDRKFSAIMKYLEELTPAFKCSLDNVAILKFLGGKWVTHREYPIQ